MFYAEEKSAKFNLSKLLFSISKNIITSLGLSQDAATRTNTSTPMGSLAMHIYRIMCNSGYDNKDFGSAFDFLKKK